MPLFEPHETPFAVEVLFASKLRYAVLCAIAPAVWGNRIIDKGFIESAVNVPVNVGEAMLAFRFMFVCKLSFPLLY